VGSLDVIAVGAGLTLLAFGLRVLVHAGASPSGVDTWYYLASADFLRRARRFPIRLPRYLLQDPAESYAPGFPLLLALLPARFVRTSFWLIAPAIDAAHLLFLYVLVYRLTEDLPTAALAGAIYALVPQLIAETRSLNPRTLGSLLASIAVVLILRFTLPETDAASLRLGATPLVVGALAVAATAALLLTQSPTGGVALGIATLTLSLVYGDPRYVAFTVAGVVAAFVLTGGFYRRVIENHLHAVRFWQRNIAYRDADQVLDSPVYREPDDADRPRRGRRWRSIRWQFARLIGENPFVIPMILTPPPSAEWWGGRMYWWAIAVLAWAVLTTAVPRLRVFGPGYIYLKSSVFPTAFSLAIAVGPRGLTFPIDIAIALAALLSVAAIGFFVVYMRTRATERTSSAPPELARITAVVAGLPRDGVLVLPNVYADYVCYHSGKSTLWGGHSGDLRRFEQFAPVLRKPVEDLVAEHGIAYVLLDLSYVTVGRLRLDEHVREIARDGAFALYELVVASGADAGARSRVATSTT
jgi:hypothetical protein